MENEDPHAGRFIPELLVVKPKKTPLNFTKGLTVDKWISTWAIEIDDLPPGKLQKPLTITILSG